MELKMEGSRGGEGEGEGKGEGKGEGGVTNTWILWSETRLSKERMKQRRRRKTATTSSLLAMASVKMKTGRGSLAPVKYVGATIMNIMRGVTVEIE